MFWTPLIDCSNGIRTESTNTLALAPGYAMATSTVGGAIEGNCDIGSVLIPKTPRNKRMIEMTIANAGRWRIFVNMVPRYCGWFPYQDASAIQRGFSGLPGPGPANETRTPPSR